MEFEKSPAGHHDEDAQARVPVDLVMALSLFARHDAAVQRHLELLERLRDAKRDTDDLTRGMERLRAHNVSALAGMKELRSSVERYTRELREYGLPPERALILVRGAVATIVAGLPLVERPRDVRALSAELVQAAIKAYYAA